ncbi:MAG: hypothetical protein Q9181_001758 [Wetmoreana brouardii]
MSSYRDIDAYRILALPSSTSGRPGASPKEIKSAYRRALLSNHPDKSQSSIPDQAKQNKYTIDEVTRAYKTLGDPTSRLHYDKRRGPKSEGTAENNHRDHHTGIEAIDLDDLDYDGHRGEWRRGCRCGDGIGFKITEDELQRSCDYGEVIAECPGCSLCLKVTFALADDGRNKSGTSYVSLIAMSKTVLVSSAEHFHQLLNNSKIVVTDFYADWCGPCKQIAPIYEQLSAQLSRPRQITFAKVNTEQQKEVAQTYHVTAWVQLPTFIIFKDRQIVSTVQGANPRQLSEVVKKLAAEANSEGSGGFGEASGASSGWFGTGLPKGYDDVTDQVDVRGLDLLNLDSSFGNARTLFGSSKPSTLASDKSKEVGSRDGSKKDWVESDTDEQLMLFIPFQSTLKVHTLLITSLPPKGTDAAEDEIPMRPRTIKLYTNRAHVLGFEEAEDIPATQTVSLKPQDWDGTTGTAKIELRFVKFQNVSSVVLFVLDGDGDGEKVRIDRLRIVGERGEKRELGKLEKIGDQSGE